MRHAHQPAVLRYIRMSKRKRFMCRPRRPLRRCAAPPPPRRWEALWAANRTSALSIAAHPVEKDSSIAKIVQIYTIGGLCASKQTLAEQVSKACDSPPTHFCRSSEARFRSVSVFRRTSTRSLAKRGVRVGHPAITFNKYTSSAPQAPAAPPPYRSPTRPPAYTP